jgi:hypothetical protein
MTEHGLERNDVLVMASDNDPFYCGTPRHVAAAEWLAEMWERYDLATVGTYLRRIHYRISNPEDQAPLSPYLLKLKHWSTDGHPPLYVNDNECWRFLKVAVKWARHLDYVPADLFVDRRSKEKYLYEAPPYHDTEPAYGYDDLESDGIQALQGAPHIEVTPPEVYGYDYDHTDQPYNIEIWIEKSTMNDVLVPLSRRFGVNLIVSSGTQSMSNAIELLQRTQRLEKPTRVLYISDLDRQGEAMPVSISRQVEFYRDRYAPDTGVTVEALVMTEEIEEEFRIPGAPLDDKDRKFGERRGRDSKVELDALEAMHLGELRRIVEDRISDYRDDDYDDRLTTVEQEAAEILDAAWEEAAATPVENLREIEQDIGDVYEEIRQEYGDRLSALQARLEENVEEINAIDLDVDLPERPEPEVDPPDESNVLFDSSRGFAEQMKHYRHHRGQD